MSIFCFPMIPSKSSGLKVVRSRQRGVLRIREVLFENIYRLCVDVDGCYTSKAGALKDRD